MSESETRRIGKLPVEHEPENRKKGRLPDVRVIIMAASVLLLFMLILFLLLFRQIRSRGHAGMFRYSENPVVFALNGASNGTWAAHESSFAAVTDGGFELVDASGETLGSIPAVFSDPLLRSGGALAAAFEIGGNTVSVMDRRGSSVLHTETEGALLDGDVSSDGGICYAELQKEYKTVLTVLDQRQNQIYRWYSGSRYMNQCALSADAEILCAVALEEKDTRFRSTAVLFETDVELPVGEIPLGEQIIWDLDFLTDTVLCAVGESSLICMNVKGELLGEYSYGGQTLKNYDMDGFTVLILNKYQEGNCNTVVTLDQNGEKLGERYLGEEVLAVSAAGGFCAVLTPEQLYVYDNMLNLCASLAQPAASAVLYEDGSVLLIHNGICTRYRPEAS